MLPRRLYNVLLGWAAAAALVAFRAQRLFNWQSYHFCPPNVNSLPSTYVTGTYMV